MRRAGSQSRGNSLYISPRFRVESSRVQGMASDESRKKRELSKADTFSCRVCSSQPAAVATHSLSLFLSPPTRLKVLPGCLPASGTGFPSCLSQLNAIYLLHATLTLPLLLLLLSPARAAYANCVLIAWPCGCQPVIQTCQQDSHPTRTQTVTTIDLLPLLTFRQAKEDLACLSASQRRVGLAA